MTPRHATLAVCAALCGCLWTVSAHADREKIGARQEAAQRAGEARQAAEAEAKRRVQAQKQQAEAGYYRGVLGAKAAGKTDAEVIQMGRAWRTQVEGQARQAEARTRGMPRTNAADMARQAATQRATAQDVVRRASGGHQRLEDLADLSDAELEALARRAAAQGAGQR